MYDFKKWSLFSIGPHLLGLIFIAVGFFTMISPCFIPSDVTLIKTLLVGSLFFLLGVVVVSSYSGVLFDFEKKRYQMYYAFAGFRSGPWNILPVVTLVKVFPRTIKGSYTPNGINPTATLNAVVYVVAIYGQQVKPIVVLEYNTINSALKGANIISSRLNVVLEIKE